MVDSCGARDLGGASLLHHGLESLGDLPLRSLLPFLPLLLVLFFLFVPRRLHFRLDLLFDLRILALGGDASLGRLGAPVEANRDAIRMARQEAGDRLVDEPEQGALHVHRQTPVRAERLELDRDLRAPAAIAGDAPKSRHQAQIVQHHRPDVEDERLRGVESVLDHADQLADFGFGHARIAVQEPLHDLGLQNDVRQTLGRTVVHRPRDLTPHVLLRGEDQSRDGRREWRARVELVGRVLRDGAAHRGAIEFGAVTAQALPKPRQDLELALEDVDLRLHDGGALRQGDQLFVGFLVAALAVLAGRPVLVGGLDPFLLVPAGLGAGLVDEQLDFADLPCQEVDFTPGTFRDL